MKRVSNRDATPLIAKREPFTNQTRLPNTPRSRPGSFRGVRQYGTRGHLPEKFVLPSLTEADYVVYSYDTPLAWHHQDTWHYASVAYSPTTSAHQHVVRMALRDVTGVVYHGGDWRDVPGSGRFWDGSPKINASTGTPAHYYGFGPGDSAS